MNYILFCGNDYYPEGGADDFQGVFETLEDAISAHDPQKYQYDGGWANIFDLRGLKIVKRFNRGIWKDE